MGSVFARRFDGVVALAVRRSVLVVVAWFAAAAVMNLAVPQIEDVAARDSSSLVPEEAPSMVALARMDALFGDGRSQSYVVVTMERPGGLDGRDRRFAGSLAEALGRDQANVSFVQDVRGEPDLRKALTSADGEAMYLLVGITGATGAPSALRQVEAVRDVAHDLAPGGLTVAVTGPTATITDLAVETEHSVLRITIVTVLMIAAILMLIYRRVSTALLVLTVVGVGLALARSVTAWCGLNGVFTVSTFSGSFLTAVVLGAATDYAVFLIGRYHEYRAEGLEPGAAAVRATTRVGDVIAGSALTVVLATGCMLLADLGFFWTTGPAIAVSVLVNLAVALTLTPALLALAGRRGWAEPRPRTRASVWPRVAAVVAARPGRTLALSLVPMLLMAGFLPMVEVTLDTRAATPDTVESNRGYELMSDHFPVNEVLPEWVLIETDRDLRNPTDLATLESVAQALAREEGVGLVRGITRPLGEPITEASLAHQSEAVGDRLADQTGRLRRGEQGAARLADGAAQVDSGAGQLEQGAGRLADGSQLAVAGMDRLVAGTARLEGGVRRLLNGARTATKGSGDLRTAMSTLADGLDTAADQASLAVDGLGLAYDALKTKSLTCGLDPACSRAREGIRQIWVAERDQLVPGLRTAAGAARRIANGTGDLHTGLLQLKAGLAKAERGADQLTAGQRTFSNRLADLAEGTAELADGIGELSAGTERLEEGTREVAVSLPELRRGLTKAARVLRRTGAVDDQPAAAGFYLPPSALGDQRFTAARQLYLSKDGHAARFAILSETDAFGPEAAERVDRIRQVAQQALAGTRIADATVSSTGIASTNADLSTYSGNDLRLIAIAALIAVFLILLLLLRSVVAAAVLMGTVVLSYAAAIGLSVLVWQVILGHDLEWIVPTVAFVLLVAVGADYNLLLAKRIREEAPDGARDGIARATAITGSVITSAGLIFAASMFALMAGSVSTLAQVGFTIGAGLLLDTFVVRSLVVPAAATLLGPRLWWPRTPTSADPAA